MIKKEEDFWKIKLTERAEKIGKYQDKPLTCFDELKEYWIF